MRRIAVAVLTIFCAAALFGQTASMLPMKGQAAPPTTGRNVNLIYHGGAVIPVAKVVFIFWGADFNSPKSPLSSYAATLQNFRDQYGTTAEYNVITQYSQTINGSTEYVQQSNLGGGTRDWFDTSTPPQNVTDAIVQAEVSRYLAKHAFDPSTIYEVFLPPTSFSSFGHEASCGGTPGYTLFYCAYHSYFTDSSGNIVKYSIEPYPSCAGCQVGTDDSGHVWTDVENQEHFICHETRESATDQQLNAWYDQVGNEADDKCAWKPTPFIDGGYGYQYEWSNAAGACVQRQ
jgi:hypothetical protein